MDSSDSDSDLERNRQSMFNAVSVKRKRGKVISEEERCSEVQGYLDERVSVNAVDDEGNTILHIAVKRSLEKVIKFLLSKGASTDIKNDQGDTAVSLAKKLGKREIEQILEDPSGGPTASTLRIQGSYNPGHDSRPVASSASRKRTGDVEIVDGGKKLKLAKPNEASGSGSGGTRFDPEHRLGRSEEEGWAIKEVHIAKGLKTSTHGVIYQVQHLVLNLYRASKLPGQPRFRLTTELDTAGKYDDLVLEYEDSINGGRSHRFVQLKHRQDEKEQIRINDLSAADGEAFSLPKYLISWRRIKRNPDFSGSQSKTFVLCTNIGLDLNGFDDKHVQAIPVQESDEFLKVTNEEEQPVRYKLRVKRFDNCKLCAKLKSLSDLHQLAMELAKCVSNASSQSINLMSDVFRYYQTPLVQEILDIENGKLFNKFIRNGDGSGRLSDEAENLRRIFLEQVKKLPENKKLSDALILDKLEVKDLKITEGFVVSARLSLAKLKLASDVKRLAQELAECVYNPSSRAIDLKTNIFEEYRAPIAQEVLDIESGKFREKFINHKSGSDPSSNEAKHLRGMFLEHARNVSENQTSSDEDIWNNLRSKTLSVSKEFVKSANEKLDSDVREFAEKLADCVYDASSRGRNLTTDILYYYQAPLAREVFDVQRGKFSDKFIKNPGGSDCLSIQATKLREIFFEKAKGFSVNWGLTHSDIWNNLAREDLKMSEEFVTSVRLSRTQLVESVKLPNDYFIGNDKALLVEINAFLDEFILAVKQPNEMKLGRMIKDEFAKDNQFNLVNVNLIKNSFDTAIINWFKKKHGQFLVREDAEKLFDDLNREIACLMTAGLNLCYSERLKNYGVNFIGQIKDLSNFLDVSKSIDNRIWQFITSKQTLLTALRIYQTLRGMKNYKEDDSYILIDLKHLDSAEIRDRVLGAFQSPSSHNLLVVDCCWIDASKYGQKLWYRLFNITQNNPRKRVIIIIEGNDDSAIDFDSGCQTCYVRDNDISTDKVEPSSLRKLLAKNVVRFQGQDQTTSFERLLGLNCPDGTGAENFKGLTGIIGPHTLVKLIRGEEIPIGDKVKGLGKIRKYHIPRTLVRHVVIKADILSAPEIDDIFAISGIDGPAMEELLTKSHGSNKSDRDRQNAYVILEKGRETDHFNNLRKQNLHRTTHWLRAEKGRLVLIKSSGNTANLFKYRKESRNDNDDDAILVSEERLADYDDLRETVILSDTAGMGKSTVVGNLAESIRDLLVIRVDLTQHTNALDMRKEKKSRERNASTGAVDFLLKDLSSSGSDLEYSIFRRIIKDRSEAAVLFDGFDEISPDYEDTVIDLLRELAELRLKKLFVTTRPHTRKALEKRLGVFSYTLKPFYQNDQIEFLTKFWRAECDLDHFDDTLEEHLQEYARMAIDLLVKSVSAHMKEFTGIPLQTMLVAEFFQDHVTRLLSLPVDSNRSGNSGSGDDVLKFPPQIDILELFTSSVNRKFEIYWVDKKRVTSTNPRNKGSYLHERNIFFKAHQMFALNAIFNEKKAKALLLSQPDMEICVKSSEGIIEGGEPIGMVTEFVDGKPQFIHRTFAEYFCAKFLVVTLKNDSRNEHLREFFVAQLFVKPEYQVIRVFLNCLLAVEDDTGEMDSWKFDLTDHRDAEGDTAYHIAARERHLGITKFLIQRFSTRVHEVKFTNIDCLSEAGHTPLFVAVTTLDNLDVVKYFVDAGADLEFKSSMEQRSLLHAAIEGTGGVVNFEVAKYLIEKGADIHSKSQIGRTPLHAAARIGHSDLVEYLLERGADIDSVTVYGATPLHLAAQSGHLNLVKFLMQKAAVSGPITHTGITLLHSAAVTDNLDLVKFLVEEGADINCKTDSGGTPLHSAVAFHNLAIVKYLIEKGADIHSRNLDDETPLHLVHNRYNGPGIVKLLLDKGADIHVQSKDGETPLSLAVTFNNNIELIDLLLENGADINFRNKNGKTSLHFAPILGTSKTVRHLIERGADIDSQDNEGWTPLHIALSKRKDDIVMYLIDRGANIHLRSTDGWTTLHVASVKCERYIVRYLFERGADIHSQTESGETCLDLAVKSGNLGLVKYCVEKGVAIQSQRKDGVTVLHEAAGSGKLEMVEYFLERGAVIDSLTDEGATPLHYAVRSGNLDLVKYLMKKGPMTHLYLQTKDGETVLHEAAAYGHLEVVQYLVKNGADIHSLTRDHKTPLHCAAGFDHLDIVKYLLAEGADINSRRKHGKTSLHDAAGSGHVDVVEYLVKEGALIDSRTDDGLTPLFEAIVADRINVVWYLVAAGADINSRSNDGKTALQTADEIDRVHIKKFLMQILAERQPCHVKNTEESLQTY